MIRIAVKEKKSLSLANLANSLEKTLLDKIYLPTLFGVESVTSQELIDLGFSKKQIRVEDAEICLQLDASDVMPDTIALLNFQIRTSERILLGLSEFDAVDFDQLYDRTFDLPWHEWLDQKYFIEVTGYSRKSKLYGVPSCQRIIKKAIIDKLNSVYKYPKKQVPENVKKGTNRIQFAIVNDEVRMRMDTSGDGLHKRGYRPLVHEAPLKETLAAAILMISMYQRNIKNQEVLFDPFCGSGTFLIEAALMATNTAPGIKRHFIAEKYKLIGKEAFDRQREYAKLNSLLYHPERVSEFENPNNFLSLEEEKRIFGSDISEDTIEYAKKCAKRAGVEEYIQFETKDIKQIQYEELVNHLGTDRILMTTNPPYGKRLADEKEAEELEYEMRELCFDEFSNLKKGIRLSLITSNNDFEANIERKADKRRKLYNGGMQCTLFHYFKFNKK